jgi:hypothetical protein
MRLSEPMIAFGTSRFGSRDSSPTAAADSKPVKAKIDSTMARKKPDEEPMWPGLKPETLTPPEPGLKMPVSDRPSPTAISNIDMMTRNRIEITMPR